MTKVKKSVLFGVLAIAIIIGVCIGFLTGQQKQVFAATTAKYTMTFSGTYTNLGWGANGMTSEIKNQTKVSVSKGISSGEKEDIILYLSGSSVSGSEVLADNAYINFTSVTISCSMSTAQLKLFNSAGSQLASGTGKLTATLSSSSSEVYRVNLYQKKQTGAGYTQWGYIVNVNSHFRIDANPPTISGASTSATGKYTNTTFTVSASDSGSGVKSFYMKAPNSSSYTQISGTSKTISKGSVNGRYAFYAKDNSNNNSATYYVNFDNTVPTLSISGAKFGGLVAKGFTVTAKDSNTVTLYYKYETDSWKAVGTSYTVSDTAKDGAHYFYAVDKGMNNAGTFHLICKDCDNKVFRDYESPENLLKIPSSKMLAEIALKNYLKLLDKKFIEEKLYNLEKDKYGIEFEELIKANCRAKIDYKRGFDKARRLSRKIENNGYYLIYHKILDYRVPVAFQSAITLAADLKGNLVNQIYNMDQKYKPAELQIGIFPLKENSAIMMFIDEGSKRYKNFIRQFKDLEMIEQLGVINYIMFLYTEDYFFSKEVGNRIDLSCLKSVSGQSLDGFRFEDENPYQSALQECDLSKWTCIPNLLSESFAIK